MLDFDPFTNPTSAENETVAGALAWIGTNAQQYLTEVGLGTTLYRGTRAVEDSWKVVTPRQDRKPLNSGGFRQEEANNLIAAAGKVANRRNSLFTTGSHSVAYGYGNPSVVIQ